MTQSSVVEKRFMAGFAITIAGLVAIAFFLQAGIRDVIEVGNERAEIGEASRHLSRLRTLLAASESAQRGFLLTGETSHLKPHFEAKVAIPEAYQQLERLFAAQNDQILRIQKAQILIDKKMMELANTIDLKQQGKHQEALKAIGSLHGPGEREELAGLMRAMEDEQENQAKLRSHHLDQIENRAKNVIVTGSILAFILFSALLLMLNRNRRRREEIEKSLRATNRVLEKQRAQFEQVILAQNQIATADLDSKSMMDLVNRLAMELTHSDASLIEIKEGDHLVYHHVAGAAMPFLGMRIKRDGSFSGLCLKQEEALICHDSESDERVDIEACRKVKLRSMIVAPLFHRGKTIGVLKNYSAQPHFFDEQTFNALKLVTGLLSAALGKAQAFEEKNEAILALEKAKAELTVSRDQAETATQAKSRFLANMSHEVRTPLNGILGMTSLMLDGPLPGVQREYAKAIKVSGEALLHLVSDVLDFSKIEAGRMELETVDFDVVSLLQDIHKSFAYTAQQKKLNLLLETDPQVPTFLKGDPGRLRQILMNLIGNAIKFTAQGEIRLRVLCLNRQSASAQLRFDVFDSGIGIEPESAKNLFQEFVQADTSTTRKFGGTGLGLSISKHLVHQMGGQIGVESEPGRGSDFWFTVTLPIGQEILDSKTDDLMQPFPARKEPWRVLVAEDNSVNQVVIMKILENFGISAEVVMNGREAVRALRERPFDLVLMDCQMPEMDGYEATDAIRKDPEISNNRIPIIAMTANALKGDRERALEAGMDDYMSKPVDIRRVRMMLMSWFKKISA